jgi:hypothetical protein
MSAHTQRPHPPDRHLPSGTGTPPHATRTFDRVRAELEHEEDEPGLHAVVTVGSEALLLLWRGYADPALGAIQRPLWGRERSADTFSGLLLASLARWSTCSPSRPTSL